MRSNFGAWSPAEGVTNHAGNAIRPTALFFSEPPKEIGQILSADSSVDDRKLPGMSKTKKILVVTFTITGLAVLFCLASLILPGLDFPISAWPWIILGSVVFGFLIGVAAVFLKPARSCSFVGEKGVARFTAQKKGDTKTDIFLFADATELRFKGTRHYAQFNTPTAVQFNYTWTDASGGKRFELKGTVPPDPGESGDEGLKRTQIPLQFAEAAAKAWSEFLMDKAQADLEKQGFIQFNLDPKHWVRVGSGFLECAVGSHQQRCEAADIKSMSLEKGEFEIVHKDARWFSSKGKFSFKYGDVANAGLFVLAVHTLVGKKFS